MPTLQGLPQELLEMIFLYSMSISLPRASPDLGRRLSSRAMTLEFCMRTFFATVDQTPHIKKGKRRLTSTGDPDLRSQLLGCKFFTWDFFIAYVKRARATLVKQRGRLWQGAYVPDETSFDGLWPFKFTKVKYIGLAERFKIPEKLFKGPWEKDKTALLYVLVSFHGEIDWHNSTAGETAKEGLMEAISEGNERAVAALAVLLGAANAITTSMLRHAVLESGGNFNILRHLLFNAQILYTKSSREVLDFHDPLLWQWVDDELDEDRAEEVKDMLRSAEKFDLRFYNGDDWEGIVPFPYSGEKFDARTAFGDMTRELLSRLYQNYGRRITNVRVTRN
jgi:large subunit ribosomal protein L14e